MRISDWSSDVCSSDLSHPVTTTRIAEAKTRAAKMENRDAGFTPAFTAIDNPLLPASIKINTAPAGSDAVQFGWVREHLRVLSAHTPTELGRASCRERVWQDV